MKAALIYNPKSGSAIDIRELERRFTTAGITLIASHSLSEEGVHAILERYVHKKDIIIAVYGGDGTQSAIAGILLGTDVVMAPLPGGTLNHFTKDLGINQNLDTALSELAMARPRLIDIAVVNDCYFINNSSVGLYPSTLQLRDEMTGRSMNKWPAAIVASIKAFWRYRSYTVTINNDTFRTPFVFIGNNDYHLEKRLIGDRKRLDEGILSVYAIQNTGRTGLLRIFLRAILHQLETTEEVKIWKTKQLTIETKKPRIRVSHDGEHNILQSPLRYRIIANGLRILGGKSQ